MFPRERLGGNQHWAWLRITWNPQRYEQWDTLPQDFFPRLNSRCPWEAFSKCWIWMSWWQGIVLPGSRSHMMCGIRWEPLLSYIPWPSSSGRQQGSIGRQVSRPLTNSPLGIWDFTWRCGPQEELRKHVFWQVLVGWVQLLEFSPVGKWLQDRLSLPR